MSVVVANRRWLAATLIASFAGLAAGCGSSGDGLPREPVRGSVALDGQAIEQGMITFEPIDGGPHAASAVIQNGEYEIERADGPLPGKHRVSIWARKPTGKKLPDPDDPSLLIDELVDFVPDRYNLQTELSVEVEAGGTNTFPFALEAAPGVANAGSQRR